MRLQLHAQVVFCAFLLELARIYFEELSVLDRFSVLGLRSLAGRFPKHVCHLLLRHADAVLLKKSGDFTDVQGAAAICVETVKHIVHYLTALGLCSRVVVMRVRVLDRSRLKPLLKLLLMQLIFRLFMVCPEHLGRFIAATRTC